MGYTDEEKKVSTHHPSDGSELIPAEVQAKSHQKSEPLTDTSSRSGYRVDEEGIGNNYAIEPEMYDAKYPSPKQQQRYLLLGIGAFLFVALAVWIAFVAS
ncbi:MAG: ssl1498 family light-harvesting-like protein [Cyanobacteria bacterium]|jgi:hypothetical protein|nr:ssl1498 family light-harvesting-like protein [Cyanobacteriota bacterium]MDA0866503.1 ssl1498 family light-harvesting-like protein [Cyanobacteriota bacterium]